MHDQITPYQSDATKKEQVRNMFDNIAPKYDLLNRMLSLGIDQYWRRSALKKLRQYQPGHVLDVACGTGDFSIAALKYGVHEVTAVDLSAEMLSKGRDKVHSKGLESKIKMVQGDSEELAFPDDTFDAATVAFGVRNFEHLEAGLRDIRRVLKPGAPLLILEFSRPKVFPVKQLFQFYFRTICPLVGRLVSGDGKAYTYLYESVQAFPEREQMADILQQQGYRSVQWRTYTFGICALYIGEK